MAGAAKGGGLRMFKLTEIDEIDETEIENIKATLGEDLKNG